MAKKKAKDQVIVKKKWFELNQYIKKGKVRENWKNSKRNQAYLNIYGVK